MRVVTVGALVGTLLAASSDAQESPVRSHPYVGYEFSVVRRTKTDHRRTSIEVFLTGDDYVGFRHREDIFGSIDPVAESSTLSNEARRKATPEEQAKLGRDLIRAGVFELKTEAWNEKSPYSSRVDVRLNKKQARYSFNTRPLSERRKAVHEVMLQFAKRMQIDRPTDEMQTTTISEGDSRPARAVTLANILASPVKFHGKRVSIIGYYHGEFEGNSLSVNREASRSNDYRNSIWRGETSTFAANSAIRDKNDSWIRVDGVFLKGPSGHMGMWPGEIVRLTRIEPLPPQWPGLDKKKGKSKR